MPATGEWDFDAVLQLFLKAGAAGGALGGAAVLYGVWDRIARDRAKIRELERLDGRDEADDGKQLRAELRGDLAQIRKWLSEEMNAHQATKKDRDRGWNLARWWFKRCFQVQHACYNARDAAEKLCARLGIEVPPWKNNVQLPNEMEDPIPLGQVEAPTD